jgi:hypothetical protein
MARLGEGIAKEQDASNSIGETERRLGDLALVLAAMESATGTAFEGPAFEWRERPGYWSRVAAHGLMERTVKLHGWRVRLRRWIEGQINIGVKAGGLPKEAGEHDDDTYTDWVNALVAGKK